MINLLFDESDHRLWLYGKKQDDDIMCFGKQRVDFKKMKPMKAEYVHAELCHICMFALDVLVVKNDSGQYAVLTPYQEGANLDYRTDILPEDCGMIYVSDRGCFNYKAVYSYDYANGTVLFVQDLNGMWSSISLSLNGCFPHVLRKVINVDCQTLSEAAKSIEGTFTLAEVLDESRPMLKDLTVASEEEFKDMFDGKGIIPE